MKLMKKIMSAAIAMAISLGNAAAFSMPADAAAVNWDKVLENGPSWLPRDFGSAMYFYNNEGKTKTDGDMICIVYHVPDSYQMSADIIPFRRDDGIIASTEYEWNKYTFNFKLPETSTRVQAMRSAAISDEAEQNGEPETDETSSFGFHYEALLILNSCAKGFDVDISLEDKKTGKASDSVRYTFVNEDGEMKETDIYSWLPDSVSEFNDYIDKNGKLSYKDGMLVYCDSTANAKEAPVDVEQTGSGKLRLAVDDCFTKDNFSSSSYLPDNIVKVYKGETEGDVDIIFTPADSPEYDELIDITSASVHVDENLGIAERAVEAPEWIPQDYESAVSFINEHGSSFVKDGIICFVHNVNANYPEEYHVSCSGSAANTIKSCELMDKIYASPETPSSGFKVMAYDMPKDSDITFDFSYGRFKNNERKINSYSFKKDSTGYVTQTDKYFWLPDCDEEFNAYYGKHGTFSIQGDYIMYCTNVPYHEYFNIFTTQYGGGALIEDHEETPTKQYVQIKKPDDEQKHIIKLFKPVKAGVVKLVISKRSYKGKENDLEDDIAYFRITDELDIVPAEEKELQTTVKGDCNGDGTISISDAVSLQRWLLGKGELPESGIADINGDGVLDVFDLVALKKKVIGCITEAPRPVLVFVDENYAWVPRQKVTVVDQYGAAYIFDYEDHLNDDPDHKNLLLHMNADNWYDRVLEIMAANDKTAAYISDPAMAEINKFAPKAEQYAGTKLNGIGYMCDAGSDSVYIVGTDNDGAPVNSLIAEYGDFVGWIDDNEAKDFVKTLSTYNIYGRNIIELLEYNQSMY